MMLLACVLTITLQPPPELEGLEYGPETTVLTEPRHADGTIDYVTALNERYGEGVTIDNNAAVELLLTIDPASLDEDQRAWLDVVLADLRVERPADFPYFITAEQFGAEVDVDAFDEMVEQASRYFWREETSPLVAQWLRENAPALERVEAASRQSRFFVPIQSRVHEPLITAMVTYHVDHLRALSTAIAVRANERVFAGDVQSAFDDAMTLRRISHLVDQEPTTLGSTLGDSVLYRSSDLVSRIASSDVLDAGTARSFAGRLTVLAHQSGLKMKIDVDERFMMLDSAQWLRMNPYGWEALIGGGELEYTERLQNVLNQNYNVIRVLESINEAVDIATHASGLTSFAEVAEAHSRYLEERQRLDRLGADGIINSAFGDIRDKSEAEEAVAAHVTAVVMTPLTHVVQNRWSASMTEQLDLIALALAAFHEERGAFPKRLDELSPEFLDEISRDRFNEQPLRYRVQGNLAIVWATGLNMSDDHGDPELDLIITIQRDAPGRSGGLR